ncbi:uncharacterized protein LOC120353401 [Nilaparvata lugens]|uniref:uncharacterized protein LOC120353401 n=1 Tax=Nilaparvata lugens TaxID=108931 RepID=UPI00193E52BD|nr:uncharacterized protein LOC120353401 [Nilaparvata lugens]
MVSMIEFDIKNTTKGNKKIEYDGFSYRKDRLLVSGDLSWRCINKYCKATMETDKQITRILKVGSHHHSHPSSIIPRSDDFSTPNRDQNMHNISNIDNRSNYSHGSADSIELLNMEDGEEISELWRENDSLREQLTCSRVEWQAAVDRSIQMIC